MSRARDLAAFVSNADGDIKFDTDTLFIDSSANKVGIGTTTPSTKLHVNSTDTSSEALATFDRSDGAVSSQIYYDGSDGAISFGTTTNHPIAFDTNNTERMRIDSSGNIYAGYGAANSASIYLNSHTAYSGRISQSGSDMLFHTGSGQPERMRIDSSGRLLVNTTSTTGGSLCTAALGNNTTGVPLETISTTTGAGAVYAATFYNGATFSGSITVNGSSTAFNTSSDYRLKENVTDVTDGITRVKQLAPKRFNFIADADTTVDGFLAHEAATVVPEAVTGTHNEVEVWVEGEELPDGVSVGDNKLDDDGNTIPKYQGIDQSKLVPLLTAALQEAIAKIETLETENTAIKARLDALEAG